MDTSFLPCRTGRGGTPRIRSATQTTSRYLVQMRFKGFRRAILSTIRDYYSLDVHPDFRSIGKSHIPVFLLWGRLDRTVPFALGKQVLQDIPQSEFHALEGVAHVGFYENPEVVNSMLIEFLNKN